MDDRKPTGDVGSPSDPLRTPPTNITEPQTIPASQPNAKPKGKTPNMFLRGLKKIFRPSVVTKYEAVRNLPAQPKDAVNRELLRPKLATQLTGHYSSGLG